MVIKYADSYISMAEDLINMIRHNTKIDFYIIIRII